jgi:hypothetical protein
MDRLPFRVENRLVAALGIREEDFSVVPAESGGLPRLHCLLRRPASHDVSILLRVHTRMGIPVAFSAVDISRGDKSFETQSLTLMAMEGYSHLGPVERLAVEARVFSRGAYVTAQTV